MLRAALPALLLAVTCLLPALSFADEAGPQFRLGFETLAGLIARTAGEPLEEEHHNPLNGDGLQQTTTGLMVWRKADNWTAFTDGWRTWVNGPLGVQERGNDERFDWEADAAGYAPAGAGDGTAASHASSMDPLPSPTSSMDSPPSPTSPASTPSVTRTVDAGLLTATPTPAPGEDKPVTVGPASTPFPLATEATAVPLASPTDVPPTAVVPTAARTFTPTSGPTAVPGGIRSPDPAGDWVTSVSPSTQYYTHRRNTTRWDDWSADNRIWFASESDLLSAYPGRTRWEPTATATAAPPTPTRTSAPAATPTPTRAATSAPTATRTATSISGGIRSADPAGDWVTSVSASTKYYTTRDNTYWQTWSADNRIWFATEADLLRAYPSRTRR